MAVLKAPISMLWDYSFTEEYIKTFNKPKESVLKLTWLLEEKVEKKGMLGKLTLSIKNGKKRFLIKGTLCYQFFPDVGYFFITKQVEKVKRLMALKYAADL